MTPTETPPPPFPRCTSCPHTQHHLPCAMATVTHDQAGMRFDPCCCTQTPELEVAS